MKILFLYNYIDFILKQRFFTTFIVITIKVLLLFPDNRHFLFPTSKQDFFRVLIAT